MKKNFYILSLLALIFLSCSRQAMIRRYYVVEMPANENLEQETKIDYQFDYKVDVRDFWVARAFDQTRIALRTQSHELNYYFYHHWAVKPSTAVADVVYEWAQREALFSRLIRGISFNPDFLIVGEIKTLERLEQDKESYAHVHYRLELRKYKSEVTLVQFETDQTRRVKDNTMNAFADTASEITIAIAEEFFGRVTSYLQENQDKP